MNRILAEKHPLTPQQRDDLFAKCRNFTRARETIAAGVYPYFHAVESAQDPEVTIYGRRILMLSSNNYLGLTNDPRVKEAAISAIHRYGTGCSGSRFLNGTLKIHEELEHALSVFLHRQATILFPTGFQANLGAISTLVSKGELVLIDKMDHASIYDGSRLSFGQTRKFRHNDIGDLERLLAANSGNAALVVVDGVFSMEGDIVDLPAVVDVCQRYHARLMVDDAHGLGVLGDAGRGTSAYFGLEDDVDLIMGTFSKSLATVGGFLSGNEDVIHYLKHHARALMFSASLPPASAAAALEALRINEIEPDRRKQLWDNAAKLTQGFRQIGYKIGPTATPIIPVVVGDEELVFQVWRRLFDEGVFVSPIVYPAVPPGMALIRTSCMATHTPDQLDRALDVFERVGHELRLIN